MVTADFLSTLRGMLRLDTASTSEQSSTSHLESVTTPPSEELDSMDILGLPNAALLSVLDRLHPREVASTCCLVSHGLRDAAISNDLWRNRFDALPEVSDLGAHQCLQNRKCLERSKFDIPSCPCRNSETSLRTAGCTPGCGMPSTRPIFSPT